MTRDGILQIFSLYITYIVIFVAASENNETLQLCLNAKNMNLTDEQRLLSTLMTSYNRETRPVFNASHPVDVHIGLSITQIFDVDEKNQVLTVNVWLDQEWTDQKLSWNPNDYNGLQVLRIPCTKLWLPDIVLYNSAADYTNKYMDALAMVSSNGNVFWPPIVKLRSSCTMDITYFPFDDQICKLKLGSWAYDGFQVNVLNRTTPVDLSNFVVNGEWDLIKASAVRNVVTYPCCDEPFPDVTFTIHIRRRTTYYIYNVIIPSVMLSSLALLGFWLHPDGGEKVTLGLTVLLALSVFMLLIAENTPATSFYVPLLGVYLITTMSFTSFSVIVAVIVSNVHGRGTRDKQVPRCVKTVMICFSKFVCVQPKYLVMDEYRAEPLIGNICKTVTNGEVHGKFQKVHCSEKIVTMTGFEEDPGICPPNNSRSDLFNTTILQTLQCLVEKSNERDREEAIKREWEEVAFILDRFIFWVFLFGTIASSTYLLGILPLVERGDI